MSEGRGDLCLGCGRGRRAGEWSCPCCSGEDYGERLEGERDLVPSPDLEPLGGVLEGLLELGRGDVAMLKGPKGIGKTTIALQALSEPWVVTNEMSPENVRRYARRIGVRLAGLSESRLIPEEEGGPRFDLGLPDEAPQSLILDSLTESGDPVRALLDLRELVKAEGIRALVVSQVTSDGGARGGPRLEHLVDAVIVLGQVEGVRELAVVKNRNGREGARLFELDAGGARLPARGGYYTIEGTFPGYRLVRHPDPRARWAGLFQAAERCLAKGEPLPFRLPGPPLATAAAISPLYPGGFTEPEDAKERRAFARSQGLPYYFPGH